MTDEDWKKVYDKLTECRLFCGVYDAGNGDHHFMYGIGTVMEAVAYYAGMQEEFSALWRAGWSINSIMYEMHLTEEEVRKVVIHETV